MIIKIVTLSLMAVFYICYFAKLISQKKQGINTDQLGKGKEGFVKFIEVALKIITYLLPVIQIISIVFCSGTAHIVLQFTGVVITMFGVLAFIVSNIIYRLYSENYNPPCYFYPMIIENLKFEIHS